MPSTCSISEYTNVLRGARRRGVEVAHNGHVQQAASARHDLACGAPDDDLPAGLVDRFERDVGVGHGEVGVRGSEARVGAAGEGAQVTVDRERAEHVADGELLNAAADVRRAQQGRRRC